MKEITSVRLIKPSGDSITKKVKYSKEVEKDLLLMSGLWFIDNKGETPILELMSSNLNKAFLDNPQALQNSALMTLSSLNPIEEEFVYSIWITGMKIIVVHISYDYEALELIDEIGETYKIDFSDTNWQSSETINKVVTVTVSNEKIDNICYRIHEYVNFPHRNLEEAILYSKDIDPLISEAFFKETKQDTVVDKRSNVFLYKELRELDFNFK